ncbi:MAG TPA: EI24 domain-containing protein [Kofleriaceae bacterium]|jgi:CysZ protein|nr:EI24 domain-containing protein [Kofleriaceae bacterium]
MTELGRGVRDVGRGFGFLHAHPRLWGWVIAPATVTLIVLIALIAGAWWLLTHAVASLTAHLPAWLDGVASWGLSLVIALAVAAGAWFVFFGLSGVIAGPFCERLSEAVEVELTGHEGPPFSLGRFVVELAIGIGHSLRRLLVSVIGAIFLLVLSFVPVVGTIAAMVLGGWFAARAAAYDSYDAVLARRAMAYRDKLSFLGRHRGRTLGLGATVAGLLLVPGVNLVALGVGAVGATLAMHDLDAAAGRR